MQCPSCNHGKSSFLFMTSQKEVQMDVDSFMKAFSLTVGTHQGSVYCKWNNEQDNLSIVIRSLGGETILLAEETLGNDTPPLVLWFQNVHQISDLVDPCLLDAATHFSVLLDTKRRRGEQSVLSLLSRLIGRLVRFYANDKNSPIGCCKHGVILNERICTTLAIEKDHHIVGLYNIVDLTCPISFERIESVQYVEEKFFEVAEEEEAMSVRNFCDLQDWTTRSACGKPLSRFEAPPKVEKRKWGHMLFLSHRWLDRGVPGTREELSSLQSAVQNYVNQTLQQGPSQTVKNIASQDDFGVWIDFPIIPNDLEHVRECPICRKDRKSWIAKMTALPSISTTIALHPDETKRGWILHEMSNNSHGNIFDTEGKELAADKRLSHGQRINLMLDDRVHFTSGSDGWELRCHEFLRLGQMPRCWPSVNLVLLQEFEIAGLTDETSASAKDVLFKYARTFHHDCQGLKRAMIVLPQILARRNAPNEQLSDPDWIKVASLPPNASFGEGTLPIDSQDSMFDVDDILVHIQRQTLDMQSLGLEEVLCQTTERLQLRQFVSVVMGLRAELLHGAGLLHWISLSMIVQALSSTKRTVRLQGGSHNVCKVSCTVSLTPVETLETTLIPAFAEDIVENGVPDTVLRHALHMVSDQLDRKSDVWSHLSGRTLLRWDEISSED